MTTTTVRLYGAMGARFGRVHRFALDTNTPAEAFAALASQVKGLREYWLNAHKLGVAFAIFVGKRNVSRDHLRLPVDGEIRIAPILSGAKRGGVLQIVAGIVLIVVGAYTENPALVASGVTMVAGGAVQMLTPIPRGRSSRDSANNQPNYNFNGSVNTQAQGNPVPVFYGGPQKVGSAVISGGIDVDDTSYYAPGQSPGNMGGGGGCVTVEMYVRRLLPQGGFEHIHAGEVRVGDVLDGADSVTLESRQCRVTFSETVLQPCVELEVSGRGRLRCSHSAPIPTEGGLVEAPGLMGHSVAVRGSAWSTVTALRDLSHRLVQHLTVDDGTDGHCFWAGERPDLMVLHHNKMAVIRPED